MFRAVKHRAGFRSQRRAVPVELDKADAQRRPSQHRDDALRSYASACRLNTALEGSEESKLAPSGAYGFKGFSAGQEGCCGTVQLIEPSAVRKAFGRLCVIDAGSPVLDHRRIELVRSFVA